MLIIHTSFRDIDLPQIKQVYQESTRLLGMERYPLLDPNAQLLESEQDLYFYLKSFFHIKGSMIAVWTEFGRYTSVLRLEPFRDGYLLTGLETDPQLRNRGYAAKLMDAVLRFTDQKGILHLYSHIRHDNMASIRLHNRFGFSKISDHSTYVDGAVDRKAATYCRDQ